VSKGVKDARACLKIIKPKERQWEKSTLTKSIGNKQKRFLDKIFFKQAQQS